MTAAGVWLKERCSCCTLRVGALTVSILLTCVFSVWLVLSVVFIGLLQHWKSELLDTSSQLYEEYTYSQQWCIGTAVCATVLLCLAALLVHGVRHSQRRLVATWLVGHGLLQAAATVAGLVYLIVGNIWHQILVILLAAALWFAWSVVWRFYRHVLQPESKNEENRGGYGTPLAASVASSKLSVRRVSETYQLPKLSESQRLKVSEAEMSGPQHLEGGESGPAKSESLVPIV